MIIKEIKYVFNKAVDHFTCHALFSTITNKVLPSLNLNNKSKQPIYKVTYQDRLITVLIDIDNSYFNELNTPSQLSFKHNNKDMIGILLTEDLYQIKSNFKEGDFVTVSGVISIARNIENQNQKNKQGKNKKHKTIVDFKGNLIDREDSLLYLEKKLGLDLMNQQIDSKKLRFEWLSYKNFEHNTPVYSKTNNNIISMHNIISMELMAFVKDAEKVNLLEVSSLGKRRSYGFGNLEVRLTNRNEEGI